METHIQSTIQGLGYSENGIYFPEPDCFEGIRDLIRFLRHDTPTGLARRLCGERNIVMSDLIPIMKSVDTPDILFDAALRLTVNLCQPTIVLFRGKYPEDREAWRIFREMEKNLCRTKNAFADLDFMKILHSKASSFFKLEWTNRTESMKMVIERIFVLLGYVLSIGESDYDQQQQDTFSEVDSGDRVVSALLRSSLGDMIVDVASTPSEHDFYLPLLHIIALIVKRHEPRDIISADSERSMEDKRKEEEELRKCVEVESQKMIEARRRLGCRHTSFAGSYVVKGMKALNPENDLVLRTAVKKTDCLERLYERKTKKRQPKNRRPFEGTQRTHLSTLDVRLALKQFCDNVLSNSYNRLMNACRDTAFNGRRTLSQRSADIHYFLVMRFFMEYRRVGSFPTQFVAATLGKESFHHVQTQLDSYLELARADRREGRIHGLKAQYAVCAYKELLCTLRCMIESGNNEQKEEAEATCWHIMLMEEYRDLSSSIIRRFMPGVLSKTLLRNLVLANHFYIGLLERYAKSGSLVKVTKRQKVRRKRTKRRDDTAIGVKEGSGADELDVDELWESISEQLSDIVNDYEMPSEDVSPIDVRLQVGDDIHQQFAALLVQKALRERRVADAVGLYRGARSIWSSEGCFGSNETSPEEEFIGMRMIFFADFTQVETKWKMARKSAYGSEEENEERSFFDAEMDEEEEPDSGSEEDEGATRYVTKEVNFNFDDYVLNFARADILKWYVFLLSDYETNSDELNKAILKLLHRVTFGLRQAPRLFQISLFRIFTRLAERFRNRTLSSIKTDPFFRLYEFGYHLLKRFFTSYEIVGSKLIPEMLFWKGPKECYDLEHGYGAYDALTNEKKSKEMLWPEELDNEIRSLYDEYVTYEDKPEGIDVVEFIGSNLSRERTRKQIIREMKLLGLDTFNAKVKGSTANRGQKSTMFSPDMLEHLKTLVDQYRSLPPEEQSADMIDYIRERLPEKYSRARIIKQLNYESIEYAPKATGRSRKVWNDVLLTELRSLAEQYEEFAEKPSCGLVDYVRIRLTEKRTRRDIETKLIEIGCNPGKLRAPKSSMRKPKPWPDFLVTELLSLKAQYEELDEEPQCGLVDYVIARLSEKRWRRDIISKLSEIGVDVSSMELERKTKLNKPESPQPSEEGSQHSSSSAISDSRRSSSVVLSEELNLVDDLDDSLVSGSAVERNLNQECDVLAEDDIYVTNGLLAGNSMRKVQSFDEEEREARLVAEAEMLFRKSLDEDSSDVGIRGKKRSMENSPSESDDDIEGTVRSSAPLRKKRIVLSDDEDQ